MFETKPLTEKDNVRDSCDSTSLFPGGWRRSVWHKIEWRLGESMEPQPSEVDRTLEALDLSLHAMKYMGCRGDVKCHPSISQRDSLCPKDRTWKIGRETPDIWKLRGLYHHGPVVTKIFQMWFLMVSPCWYHLVHGLEPHLQLDQPYSPSTCFCYPLISTCLPTGMNHQA